MEKNLPARGGLLYTPSCSPRPIGRQPSRNLLPELKIMAKKTATTKNGKETASSKPEANPAVKPAVKPAAKPASKGAAKLAAKPASKPAAKPVPKGAVKPRAASPAKTAAPKKSPAASRRSGPSSDEIALRAYFLAEKRQKLGLPGDSHSDWLEAERQLASELKAAKATR